MTTPEMRPHPAGSPLRDNGLTDEHVPAESEFLTSFVTEDSDAEEEDKESKPESEDLIDELLPDRKPSEDD